MRTMKTLAITSLAVAGLAFAGCERRAPNVDDQARGYTPSTDPATRGGAGTTTTDRTEATDRVPEPLDRQPVAGREPGSTVPGTTTTTETTATASDIFVMNDDGTRTMLHDSALLTQVQQKLSSEGLYTGTVDGRATPELASAIREYQAKKGLPQTGAIDKRTADAMGLEWSRLSAGGASGTMGDTMREAGRDIESGARDLGRDIKEGAERTGERIEEGAEDIRR
jgi:predicted small secreted protein